MISGIHWIVTLAVGLCELRSSNFHFFQSPDPSHPFWSTLLNILEVPLLTIYRVVDPQRVKYYLPVMTANSLLWGVVVNTAITIIKKRRRGSPVTTDYRSIELQSVPDTLRETGKRDQ